MARFVYTADRRVILHGQAGVTEDLGQADGGVSDGEVISWLTLLAVPFDTITTPEGTFVVSRPAAAPPRRTFAQPAAAGFRS